MATYIQADRPLTVTTPLGKDDLLLVGFWGQEVISQLFKFELDLMAENGTNVPFEGLLGQKVTINLLLPDNTRRHFNGICSRVSQGQRDETFTGYRMEMVPQFWFLTRRAQSRIFQHKSVPEILKIVLAGLDVAFELKGTYHARDFCVQYRETDFNFASRVMEEEGIFYFFKHTADGHKMIVADTPQSFPPLPEPSTVLWEGIEGGNRPEDRITTWEKLQELRSGKFTLWDHSFELPHKHLEAEKVILDSVAVGKVTHRLKVGQNDRLELYDFPGEYAQRFDGVDRGGGDRPDDIPRIFEDNKRTVEIRMQQEAVPSLLIRGNGTCRHFVSGHRFTLRGHFNADGPYLLTGIQHVARLSGHYRSGEDEDLHYDNGFTCIPAGLPFRPVRDTSKPFVQGSQTAVVVGPPGQEIFTDKYGRVKVQFHWDREGKNNADSSCWIRVGQLSAGRRWGTSFWPRVGQEVIVDFLEGDPDQPIIVGTVYNADQMPPYLGQGPDSQHPNDNKVSGIKTNTTPGGVGFNELRFDDTKDKQQVFIHAEKDLDVRVKNDGRESIGHDRNMNVGRNQLESVGGSKHGQVKGSRLESIGGDLSLTVGSKRQAKIGTLDATEAGQEIHLKAGVKIIIEAGTQISLVGPGGFINIGPEGVTVQGTMVKINSGGSKGTGTDAKPASPTPPVAADDAVTGRKSSP